MKTKVNWRRVPSVTYGGKPYFFVALLDVDGVIHDSRIVNKACVAWHRIEQKWEVSTGYNFEIALGLFDTARAGQRFVEGLCHD